jgi:hypothetical protein
VDAAAFPSWEIGEDFELYIKTIPFGVLTDENVMRELLAFVFLKSHSLAAPHTPVVIMQYGKDSCCVVFRVQSPQRAEALVDDQSLRTHDFIRLASRNIPLPNREARLKGVDEHSYRAAKVHYLLEMQFHGGFRGILNSNIGNDVVNLNDFVGVCDLDTFTIEEVPKRGGDASLDRFVTRCILEAIKSSLPLLTWLDMKDEESINEALAESYKAHSSFFQDYRAGLTKRLIHVGAKNDTIEDRIENALRIPLAAELLTELIPNSITFNGFKSNSFYTPHH